MPPVVDNPKGLPPSPRNFWPAGIVIAFVVFGTGTAALVVMSALQRVDLVTPDYYAQELRYQEQIDRHARTQAVRGEVRVAYEAAAQRIVISLPPEHAARQPVGRVLLYRPSAAGLDRQVPLEVNAAGQQALEARALARGLWRVRVTWTVDHQDYAHEQRVVLPSGGPE